MSKLKNREINLIKTDLLSDCGKPRCFFGLLIKDEEFYYENKFISPNHSQVKFLIHKIEANMVQNIHIENVVEDFLLEHNLS